MLDGDTLETLEQIPIGFGARHPYLSNDGTRLFASSDAGHFAWELDELSLRSP